MKTLIHGGTIYTMEKERETVEAVLIADGKIMETGDYQQLAGQEDTTIHLNGASMYPGFVDSHLHMIALGESLTTLDLSQAASKQEMLEMIMEAAKELPDDAWLFAEGWNENNFPDKAIPLLDELDNIRKGPTYLRRICRHAALANSAALSFGGISSDTPDPAGGKISKLDNGSPDGLLYDQAMNLITDKLPKEGQGYIDSLTTALDKAINKMLALGLTGGHTEDMSYFGAYTNPLSAFTNTIGKHHHFRANLLRHHTVFEEMAKDQPAFDQPFIEPGAMKIFTDGAFGGRTAALSVGYADDPENKGLFLYSDAELEKLIKIARNHNEAVAVHMIGDAAVEQTLNIVEKFPPPEGKRDRFIHCSLLREDLLERIAKLPIVVDAQPAFVSSDFPWLEERLGKERIAYAYPWKSLIDQGIMCAAGTDAPIEQVDPLRNIYAAVERKSPGDAGSNIPEQIVTRFEAIQMYTIGSAQAINKENERGLIKPGYDADFSIFDRDLFTGSSEDMLKATAIKTIVAGKVVFEK